MMVMLLRFYGGLSVFCVCLWFILPRGRQWLASRIVAKRRQLFRPEKYPDDRLGNTLRGRTEIMSLLLWLPLSSAVVALSLHTPPPPGLHFAEPVIRLVLGLGVMHLARQTFLCRQELQASPWMRARRLIDRYYS